ncbi:MAG: TIGR02646 family protein [Oceanospirillaceae bacterium]|nr:TIGR02646 family protein [Oceanospirillaceae bacterium]
MKHLKRSEKPECLNNFSYKKNTWDDLKAPEKEEIWIHLDEMQAGFCAYCECSLDQNRHIEHFARKKVNQSLTFVWENLFGSCGYHNRCGHHKDSSKVSGYDINDILKPDVDDPEFYFVFNSNGKISAKSSLSELDNKRAEETIRVFNLGGDVSLVGRRRTAIRIISHRVSDLYDFWEYVESGEFSQEEWEGLKIDLLNEIRGKEFEGALKSYVFEGYFGY